MPDDSVLEQLKGLHDHLLDTQPSGAAHDREACAYCTKPEEGSPVTSGKTYTEAELQAQVTVAVSSAVGDLRTQLEQLTASQEAAAVEERIATAVAEATAPLTAKVTELEGALDAAKIEAATEKARADQAEAAVAEGERAAAIAARRDDRLGQVKELSAFDDDYLTANADRWAAMDDEAFAERVAEYAALAGKKTEGATTTTMPTTTALTAAVQDKGASGRAPGKVSAVKELSALRRAGVDIRNI